MSSKPARRAALAAACMAAVLGASACSSGEQPAPKQQPQQQKQQKQQKPQQTGYQGRPITGAAEPGKAPEPDKKPVGTVTQLPKGAYPWGVAADHSTGSVAVALRNPGRLAVYDTRSGKVRVQPGPIARMIDLTGPGGDLMVPAETENALYTVRLPGLQQVSKVPAGTGPHQAVRVGDTTFVSDERGHAVRALRDGKTVKTMTQPVQPGGITAVGNRVAAVDVATSTLFVYDAKSMKLVAALPAGKGPSHVVPAGGNRVAVCDVRGNAIFTYDIGGKPRQLGRADVPGRAFWVEADPRSGTVYAALSNTNKIAKLRLRPDGSPTMTGTVPTVRQPISMDRDPVTGTLYVAGSANSELQTIPRSALRS